MTKSFASAFVALMSLSLGTAALHGAPAAPSATAPAAATQSVSAADARLRYEGRFDFADRAAPSFIWQGSRISLDFTGETLAVLLESQTGESHFDVTVDGRTFVASVPPGGHVRAEPPFPLGPGRHHLTLFKRSEASAGIARFRGVELAAGAGVFAPPPPAYRLAMEFFGDSITVGACNEDGDTDQWESRRTHNNALSYGALTAAAFSADYRNLAISGMGIVTGYVEVKAGEVWDRLYPEAKSPRADLAAWQPDVAFVNYGENDDSFTRSQHQPFPAAEFTRGYVSLVRHLRAAYPKTHLVLLRGGMFGGAKSDELRPAWEAAVRELEAGDPAISHYVFQHWSSNHPRVADDRAMADELIAWLKQQPFFAAYQ